MPQLLNQCDDAAQAGLLRGLTQVSDASFALDHRMEESLAAVEAQASLIDQVTQEAKEAAQGLTHLAAEAVDAAQTARSTSAMAHQGADELRRLQGQLESLDAQQGKTEAFFRGLEEDASTMRTILESIEDISAGLGVLAINATIEAARAGHAGRGFAVIAKEVQKVSHRTIEASQQAARLVRDLEARTGGLKAGLAESRDGVRAGILSGRTLTSNLQTTADDNRSLLATMESMRDRLASQALFAQSMQEQAVRLDSSKSLLGTATRESAQLAELLRALVEDLLVHTGGLPEAWTALAQDRMMALAHRVAERTDPWDEVLRREQDRWPLFSLLYVMNRSGIQVSGNIVAAAYRGLISEDGKGANRSDRPYFQRACQGPGVALTEIYLSTASRALCLTASIQLPTGEVLAGDLTLADLVKEADALG